MAKGFNLTAELNLRGPSNIKAVVSDMRRQIGTVSATVTPVLDKSSLKSISSEIKKQLGTITGNVNVRLSPSSAKNIANDVKKQLSSISANINIGVNASAVKSAGKTIKQQLSGLVVPIGVSASATSINQIKSKIKNQLGNLNVTVNVRLNSGVNQTLTTYNTNLTRLNNLLIQTATNATAAANSIDALAAAMRSASGIRLQPINANLGNIGNNASRAGQAVGGATNEIENFGRQAGLAIRRFAAFSSVAGVVYGITNAFKNGIAAFITYDQQLTKISQVTGDAKDKLGDITSTISALSTSLGVSSAELASTTLTLAQAGLTAKETEQALRALALSALAPSFDDMNQTVEGSIALMRQFNIGSSQLESALGSINSVSAKFAVEASDIITAIQRTGGVFAASSRGVSEGTEALNEFIAVFTSIRATTRESAETIATGLRTIFTRIQRAETIEALKEFGVTLTDLEGKFVGPYIAVQRLSEGLGRLDSRDLKFSSIVEELGGFRQIGKVLPLIQQFGTAQEALKVAQSGQGSLALDAAKGQQALAVQIAKVKEQFLGLIRSVGNTNSFQKMVQVGLDLASALIRVADAAKELIPIITLFAAARGAQAITQFAGGFGQGFRGAPARRAAEGGPIRHFASGGYVPGFGNGDTVSAKLTPGEFVMRKSAVQSIGVGNLQSLNRSRGGITTPINRYGLGTQSARGVQQNKSPKEQKEQKKLPIEPGTVFAHLDTRVEPENFSPRLKKYLKKNGINIEGIYSNMGLELPANWNSNWALKPDRLGVFKKDLGDYISRNKVFDSLINSSKIYRFTGRSDAPATKILKDKNKKIQAKLASKIKSGPVKFYDTDQYEVSTTLPNLLKQSIREVMSSTDSDVLIKGFEEKSVYKEQGKPRQAIYKPLRAVLSSGGSVRKFADAGIVTPTAGKKATTSEIIKLLGLETAAKIGGISATDVYTTLNKRTPTPQQAASKAAILAEFTKKQNRLSGAKQARTTRITSKGLLFGAAGMLGSAFAPINKKITSDQLKAPVDVRILSGIMDPKVASATEQSFTSSLNKTAGMAAKKVMVADILAKTGLGRELNLDFDRTLAFGADKILSDPKTPKFAEFGDRSKVAAALKGAKLSLLGKELAGLVSSKPELLGNLKLITARPASTLDLVQGWLFSKGLPIPLSQFKGLGGPGVSGSQIAKLKAALLSPGSLFVDDDARNIKAAKARSKEGIIPYRYGNRKISGNPNAEATAQGTLFEKMIQKLGGPGALKGQGMDFPQGLKGAAKYFGIPGNIATDAKRTISGPSTVEDNIITYLKTKGYAGGGYSDNTVPALVSNGEAYVPPELAKSIGYPKLRQMNRADRNGMKSFARGGVSVFKGAGTGTSDSIGPIGLPVGSFIVRAAATKALGLSSGGPVGNVQEFATGGAIQRFFLGGGPRARPTTINTETIGVSGTTAQALRQLSEVLEQLGVSSSRSAALLNRGYQATAAEAQRAYQADLVMARAAGASADVIYDLERALQRTQREAQAEVRIRQELANVSGTTLQQTLAAVDEELQRLTASAEAAARATGTMTDEEIEADLRANAGARRSQAFENVNTGGALTGVGGGIDLVGIGATGEDLERTIQALMRDADTLDQMNREYIRQRREAIAAEARAAGDHARAARIRAGAEDQVEDILREEVNARRAAIRDTATVSGSRDTGTQPRDRNRSLLMAGGIITAGTLISQQLDTKSSAATAGTAAGLQSASQSLGVGIAVVGQLNDFARDLEETNTRLSRFGAGLARIGSTVATAGTAIFTIVSAVKDTVNAMNDFKLEVEKQKLEFAMKGVEQELDILRKSIRGVDFTRLNTQLENASKAYARTLNLLNNRTTVTFTNFLDWMYTLMNRDPAATEGLNKRSDILRLGGTAAYYRSRQDETNLKTEFERIIPQLAQEQAAMGKVLADSLLESFKMRASKGESTEDIVSDPNFAQFSEALANADVVIKQRILELENSNIPAADIDRIRKGIVESAAEDKVRQQVLIATREKEIKSLQRSTFSFTGSLNRMFKNMEQAISATSNALANMQQSIDATISSLTGQAGLKNINLQTSNILSNPRAYGDNAVSEARSTASGFFGQSAGLVKSLLGFGATAENTVMQTINDVVKNNPEANDEVIASRVNISVREALKNLGLPPEIGDKLAQQVGRAIGDLRKSNDDEISFGDLQEKVSGLSSVLETAQGVESITSKALESFGEALNSYSNNINKIIDIEISSRDKLRKANDILINSGVELSKVLGKTVNLEDSRQRLLDKTKSLTGGPTNPADITQQILSLNNQKTQQESSRAQVAERGPAGAADFVRLSNDVKQTSIALRESYSGLKLLAESTEFASDAMQRIQDAQQRNSGKVSFIEKLVTSTPEEISTLNSTFSRLQRNMNGQINTINNSIGAQKAYVEAIQNGATNLEAMKAAQAAFTNERKDTLGLLQDIMPFLGEGRKASNIKANVLESMLNESGVGVSPMLMDVLNNLRNPEADPAVAAAMSYYNEAISLQADANRSLAKIDEHLARDTAEANAEALSAALSKVTLTFFNAELKDIAAGINNLVPLKPQAKALGGVIYASAGQMVDFQAKGSDTVPAMLTPGEFVVNRAATARNRPLLESINSNHYSSGGSVRYYAHGGFVHNMGDIDRFAKSSTVTSSEILKLDDNTIQALLKAQDTAYQAPSVYTFLDSNKQAPMKEIDVGNPNEFDFRSLEPEAGATVVPGMGPVIARTRANSLRADYQEWDEAEDRLSRFMGIKGKDSFLFMDPLEMLTTAKVKQLDWERYQDQATTNRINWELPEYNLDLDQFGNMPAISDFKSPDPDTFAATLLTGKSYGIAKEVVPGTGPALSPQGNRMYKIWAGKKERALAGPDADAISKDRPEFEDGHRLAGSRFTEKPFAGKSLVIPDFEKNIIPYTQLGKLKADSSRAYEKYTDTANFLNAPDFDESGEIPAEVIEIQSQLAKIYNGNSAGEIIKGAYLNEYFADLAGAKDAKSLMIVQNTAEATNALKKSIEEFAANPVEAKNRKLLFSGPGLAGPVPLDFVKDDPIDIFSIDKLGAVDQVEKSFPFVVNGTLNDLDPELRKKIEEGLAAKNAGDISMRRLPPKSIQFPVPNQIAQALGTPGNAEMQIVYDEWKGKLYDPVAKKFTDNPITTLLPANVDKTLFESLNIDKRRLSKSDNTEYNAIDIGQALASVDWNALAPQIKAYADGVSNNKPDDILAKEITDKINGTFKSSYVKSKEVTFPGLDTLITPISNSDTVVNMGRYLLERIEAYRTGLGSKADTIAGKPQGFTGLNDSEIPAAVRETAKAALSIFGTNEVPGLPRNWLGRYIGRLPMATKMKPDFAKRASAYASSVMENFGGYLGNISNNVNTPNQYQYLKKLWTLASGASQTFSGLANGDTGLLAQFKGSNLSLVNLFTSLGGGTLLRRIMGLELNNDWKNLLANQLTNGKTRTVGANKLGAKKDMADSVPKTLQELIDLLFNPYNEFDSTNKRSSLITKFLNDLTNFKQPNGVPYFDKDTMNFITDNVDNLRTWYGGDNNNFLGADYFFDKNANQDNVQRTTDFLANLNRNQDIYDMANRSHIALGLGNKFGILPNSGWFTGRAAQGFQTGGMVYAADGGQMVNFQPRGTDTVPAMLTPGEFVINRQATQANLPLLKAINKGSKPYSNGGIVYAVTGGQIDMNESGPSNTREALLDRERQSDKTAVFQEGDQTREIIKLRKMYSLMQELESSLIADFDAANKLPHSEEQYQFIKELLSQADTIRAYNAKLGIMSGVDGLLGTDDDVIPDFMKSKASALDNVSMTLSAVGLTPGLGLPADLAAIIVDAARGDMTSVGLDVLGAGTEIAGQAAGAAKIASIAQSTGAAKLSIAGLSGIGGFFGKQAKMIDLTQSADLLRTIHSQDLLADILRSSVDSSVLKSLDPDLIDNLARQIYDKGSDSIDMKLGLKQPSRMRNPDDVVGAFDDSLDSIKQLKSKPENMPLSSGIDDIIKVIEKAKGLSFLDKNMKSVKSVVRDINASNKMKLYGAGSVALSAAILGIWAAMDQRNVYSEKREQRPQEELRAAITDITPTQLSAKDLQDIDEGRGTDEQKAKKRREEAKTSPKNQEAKEKLEEIQAIQDRYRDRLGPERRKMLDESYKNDLNMRHKRYKQDAEMLERRPDKVYKNKGGVIYASEGTLVNYQPRGTDTVPAMLTPGEFVVNAKATRSNLSLLQSINKSKGGVVYAAEGGMPTKPDGSADTTFDARKTKRIQYLEKKIQEEERGEFKKLDILYNDTTDKEDIAQSLKRQKDYKTKIDYYLRQFSTDDQFGLRLKRFPRISAASKSILAKEQQPKANPFDQGQQPAATPQSLSRGGVVYMQEGGLPTKPDGSADASFNSRKDQRSKYLEAKIQEEERLEFRKLGILYNDTTDKKDIIEALKKQRDYKTKIDYYLRQFSTDNQFGLRLKRYPRISKAGKSILAEQEQPKANPFDQGQQPAATPQSLEKGGVIYASEGTLVNYQPRGTDTVPAMLTPGEFVVNAKAAQANLPLLYSINSGSKTGAKKYSSGGIVYLEDGGEASFDGILGDVKAGLDRITEIKYDPIYEERIKDTLADREARGVKRVERTRRNPKTGQYETTTGEEKTDAKRQEEKEARDKKNQEDIDSYSSFEKQRQNYLKEIRENKPKQEEALRLAAEAREKLRVMKVEFIAQIENKVKTEAQRLGVSLKEFLEVNDEAAAEWNFIKGNSVNPVGDIFTFLNDISDIINTDSIFKGGDISMKALSIRDIDTPRGRGPFFQKVGAKELYAKDEDFVTGILPDEFQYVSGREDKVIGPISLMSGGDRGVGPRRPPQKEGVNPETFSTGGIVYASNGMLIPYEPKGTDTVPAMLTPGEFVVNRAATQANLPLLKAINNGQTKAYSKGGVVYLDEGGLSQRDKALSQSPAGQLILAIKQQAEGAESQFFAAINPSAFSTISSGDLYKRYNDVWSQMDDPNARYTAAKTQYTNDKKRVDFLTGIYNNSAQAYAMLSRNQLAINTKIDPGQIPLLTLLKGQEAAMTEAKAIHETWISLAKTYPEFRGDIGQGAGQAAGTAPVAGATPPPEPGADKPPGDKPPVSKQYGGMVYAAAGGSILPFTPISRGTDTVPAMLTPGEFVVNRTSTQRNLPLLQAINNNRYANGGQVGKVNYLYQGGQPTSEAGGGGGVSTGGGSASVSTDGLSQFTTTFQSFIDQLKNLNPVINLKGEHNVNVNFNGAQYLAVMDESIRKIVLSEVNAAMETLRRDTDGALGGR